MIKSHKIHPTHAGETERKAGLGVLQSTGRTFEGFSRDPSLSTEGQDGAGCISGSLHTYGQPLQFLPAHFPQQGTIQEPLRNHTSAICPVPQTCYKRHLCLPSCLWLKRLKSAVPGLSRLMNKAHGNRAWSHGSSKAIFTHSRAKLSLQRSKTLNDSSPWKNSRIVYSVVEEQKVLT